MYNFNEYVNFCSTYTGHGAAKEKTSLPDLLICTYNQLPDKLWTTELRFTSLYQCRKFELT